MLDQILSGIQVSESWEAAIKRVIDNPEIELVTLEGDYFNGASWQVGPLISGATGSALDESIRKSEEMLNETKRAEEVLNHRLKELETQETNRAIAVSYTHLTLPTKRIV